MAGSGGQAPDPRIARWSALHHGIDPTQVPLLAGWLRGMWGIAGVLARLGVPPTAVTVTGVVLAVSAVAAAGSLPLLAAALVLLAAVCDAVDGAVAVVANRATAAGARADAIADRCCDVAFALVLGRCGAPWAVAAAAAALAVVVDTLRRALRVPATITVAERPTVTVCAVLGCLCAAVSDAAWPVLLCAVVWLAACCLAAIQLLLASGRSAAADRP